MRNRFILAFIFLVVCHSQSQDLKAALTHEQAIHDVETLVALLEATHPDPYINVGGKIAFKRDAQELADSIPASGLTVRELGNRLDPFLRRLQDGHTYLFYYADKWRDSEAWLPIRFGVAEDGLFVSAFNVHELDGTQGWKVVGVNGVSLDELHAKWMQDGSGENLYADLPKIGNVLCSLKFMGNLLPGVRADGSITYTLEAPDGHRENRSVPWSARALWDADKALVPTERWSKLNRSNEMFYYQIFDHPSAAYLRVSTIMGREAYEMAYHMNAEDGQRMIEDYYQSRKIAMPQDRSAALAGIPSLFETVVRLLNEMKRQSVPDLIIDLRDNEGGFTPTVFPSLQAIYGDSLYAKPMPGQWVHVESALYLKKYGETLETEKQKDPTFEIGRYVFDKEEAPQPADQLRKSMVKEYLDAGFSLANELNSLGGTAVYTPRHVVVLVNPGTFSAAFHMMMYLRAMGAKVVGVPSSQSPNAFMEQTEFTLPESKLRGSISNSAQIFLPDDPHARVLEPDYPVTIAIYRRCGLDVDTPLRYALDLLQGGRL
jgi:hypothetical protein